MRRLSIVLCVLFFACETTVGGVDQNPSKTQASDPNKQTPAPSGASSPHADDPNADGPIGSTAPEPTGPTPEPSGPSGASLPPAPEVPGTIAPTHLQFLPGPRTSITVELNAATVSIHAGLYLLTDYALITALKNAASRGVTVQVVIDDSDLTHDNNVSGLAKITAAGATVVKASGYSNHHAKYAVIDGAKAIVSTCNWSSSSFTGNREAITIVEDATAVHELDDVFQYDFAGTTLPYTSTRWVLSPNNRGAPQNSRERIEGLVQNAKAFVFVVVQDLDDYGLRDELVAAHDRGIQVRLLMADPAARQGKSGSAPFLKAHGVPVRYLTDPYLHEKLLVADDEAYIGSHNFTYTAIEKNREVGMVVVGAARDALLEQAETDWASGTDF